MSGRRIVLGALFVALLASLLLVVVAWRAPAPRSTSGSLPAGLVVVAAVR